MRDLGSYAMVYLLAGGGEFGDALGHVQTVGPGDLIWLFPGVPHYYGPRKNGFWDEIYLVFDGPLIDLWRKQKIISASRPVWHLEPVAFWHRRLEEGGLPPAISTLEDSFQHLSRFQLLVAEMSVAAQENSTTVADRARIEHACRLLEASHARSLEDVARAVGMSYESFRKKFTAQTGRAPARYRQGRLIERACELLMRRNSTQKDIARQLGFCDEFHFSKVFRQNMGVSPRAFRLKTLGARRSTRASAKR
jgi:AraC-like DNA-binding protein